jgi:AcrR family transcriptional regulator
MTLQLGLSQNIYNQIKEAACFLFRLRGYENTSVTDLVEKLQNEEQSFFIYFQSMDEHLEVIWSES